MPGTATKAAPPVRRAAILGLSEWPSAEPLEDLLSVAREPQNRKHQLLALRGYIKLAALPAGRAPAATVALLATAYCLAAAPEEKKAVLGLLPRYPSREALALAERARAEEAAAKEAKAAMDGIKRLVADQ